MGACTYGKSGSGRPKAFELLPQDILSFDSSEEHSLDFEANLSNVKLQNLSSSFQRKSLCLEFKINEIITMTCQAAEVKNAKLKWPTNVSFSFANNHHGIRSKYLLITLSEKGGKVLSELKINLFRIMSGPFHHDFFIGKKEKMNGRLIFDLRIEQVVCFSLECLKANVQFCKEYPGQKFAFSLESYNQAPSDPKTGNHRQRQHVFKTIPSYAQQVPFEKADKFRQISTLDEAPSPTYRLKRKASNLIKSQSTSSLQWSVQRKKQMPGLSFKIKATEVLSSSFGFKLFNLSEDNKNIRQFGYYGITLSEILSCKPENQLTQSNEQWRLVKFEKKLWQDGKCIAKCQLSLDVRNSLFIRQMTSHTQTEDGILNMNFYETYTGLNVEDDPTIGQLEKNYKQILEVMKQKTNTTAFSERANLNESLLEELESLQNSLSKNIRRSYIYHTKQKQSIKKLQNKQNLLLNIMQVMSCLIEEEDLEIGDICWKVIIEIMKRGEMVLRNWQFTDKEEEEIKTGSQSGELKKKVSLSLTHWYVLNKLLKQAMDLDVDSKMDKQHSEIFKAYCYFRVPIFRDQFLSSIYVRQNSNTSDGVFEQNDIMDLNGSFSMQKKLQKPTVELSDWQNKFYRILKINNMKSVELTQDLQKFLHNHFWFDVLAEKDQVFFNFIRYLMAKLAGFRTLHKNSMSHFNGYSTIVNTYISTMESRDITEYTTSMLLAGISLLENEKLFPSLLRVVYEKTNIYNQASVLRMLGIVSHFIDAVFRKRQTSSFPYDYFMKNLITILDSLECSISVSQTLTLLYNHYDRFQQNFRYELSVYFLGETFWKFFYHWSYNVRRAYYHIILLRIAQDDDLVNNTDIKERLDEITTILANVDRASQQNKQSKKENLKIYYKAMKDKLKIKKALKDNKLHNRQQVIGLGGKSAQSIISKKTINYYETISCDRLDEDRIEIPINQPKKPLKPKNTNKRNSDPTATYVQTSLGRIHTDNYDSDSDISQIDWKNSNKENIFNDSLGKEGESTKSTQYQIFDLTELKLKKSKSFRMSFHEHKFSFACFEKSNKDGNLAEMNSQPARIEEYSGVATKQFREIVNLLNEHIKNEGFLPAVDLGVKVEFDEKEILPTEFDMSLID